MSTLIFSFFLKIILIFGADRGVKESAYVKFINIGYSTKVADENADNITNNFMVRKSTTLTVWFPFIRQAPFLDLEHFDICNRFSPPIPRQTRV